MEYKTRTTAELQATGPRLTNPNKYSYFIGTVVSTSEADGDKQHAYQVKFNIDGLPEFTEEFPVATPLFDAVREVKVGDKIIIFNLSNDPLVYTFFYFPLRQERFTGLKNYENIVDVTDEKIVKVKFPGYEATFSDGAISINATGATINIIGNVKITGNLTATQISTDTGVDLNTHIHLDPLGTTGAPIV